MNGPDDPQPPVEPPQPPAGLHEQPPEPPSRVSRARVTAWILVVLVVLAGGGAALVLRATNAEQSVDKFVPENVAAFVKVSLKSSSSQRDGVRSLLSKLPSDLRSQVQPKLDDFLQQGFDELGLSWKKDIQPWIGGQLGVAIQPPSGATSVSPNAEPTFIGLITVKDVSAARVALEKAYKADPTTSYKIFGSLVYLGDSEKAIDDFRNSITEGHTLADNATYKHEYERSGADSLVFAYFNVKKLGGLPGVLPGDILGGASGAPVNFGVATVAVQASSNGLSIVGHAQLKNAPDIKTFKPELLESTSGDLLGAISLFDLGSGFKEFLSAIKQLGAGGFSLPVKLSDDPISDALGQFEQALGLNLEKDVLPWLHGELSIILGPPVQPPFPDVAVLIDPTDDKALDRTMAALRTHLGPLVAGLGGRVTTQNDGFTVAIPDAPPIVVKRTDARLAIATGNEYADKLLHPSGASLAGDTVYRSVVGTNEKAGVQIFLRLDRLRPLIEGFAKLGDPGGYADYERNVQPYLKPLQAFGLTASRDGDEFEFRMTVTLNP